jgi:hypothetical protein
VRAMVCGDAIEWQGRWWGGGLFFAAVFRNFFFSFAYTPLVALPPPPPFPLSSAALSCMSPVAVHAVLVGVFVVRWHRWRCLAVWVWTSCDHCPPSRPPVGEELAWRCAPPWACW